MVSRYHWMALMVPKNFTKSHQIRARRFFHIFEATLFLQHKWEGLLTISSTSLLILDPTLERSCIIALWEWRYCSPRWILHYLWRWVNVHAPCIMRVGCSLHHPARWTLSKAMKHSKKVVWRIPYGNQYSNISPSKEEGSYAYYLRAGGTLHLWAYTYYLGMGVALCRFTSIRSR
jgi:hypothetical protein